MEAAEFPGSPVAGAQFSEDVSEDTLSIATFISVFYNQSQQHLFSKCTIVLFLVVFLKEPTLISAISNQAWLLLQPCQFPQTPDISCCLPWNSFGKRDNFLSSLSTPNQDLFCLTKQKIRNWSNLYFFQGIFSQLYQGGRRCSGRRNS